MRTRLVEIKESYHAHFFVQKRTILGAWVRATRNFTHRLDAEIAEDGLYPTNITVMSERSD